MNVRGLRQSTRQEILDREFLNLRAALLDLAALLDRIDRASPASTDERWERIQEALKILAGSAPHRAEGIQRAMSLPYQENWRDALAVDTNR